MNKPQLTNETCTEKQYSAPLTQKHFETRLKQHVTAVNFPESLALTR